MPTGSICRRSAPTTAFGWSAPRRTSSGPTPGQPIGGVAPVGHPQPIRTLVDRTLAAYPVLWAAGGIPHAVFPVNYSELIRLTSGEEVDVN